ncbi:hypothetical protein SAMN05428978_101548 [Nitrosomonas sp. Nm34]|nr:hypothetical protein SAMN05428978_101548 [Nitrosomonas sp. Nm34]
MPALGTFAFFDKIYAQYCYYCDFIAWIWRTSDYLYITLPRRTQSYMPLIS